MSEIPTFYDNYPGETVEHGDDPKYRLGYEPEPTTGETVVYGIDDENGGQLPPDEGEQ